MFGLLFNLGLGVLSRLMPQMQVFFIGLPLSILLGFMLLVLVMGAMMGTFTGYIENVLGDLAPGASFRSAAWPMKPTLPIKQKTRHKNVSTTHSNAATSSRARRSIDLVHHRRRHAWC